MKKVIGLLMMVLLGMSLSISSLSLEAASKREPRKDDDRQQCRLISKSSAMRAVAARIDGKVISAFLTRSRPPVYRVKTLSKSGRVRSVSVNACNGQVYG
ncbi:PepSY domain-containing protein [Kangiella sp. TOML190]|uniref:PepSY domain-containing protein n=1 Tax=Kangiella sp. TOML190 TaxID=2931351 RepID=UPI002041F3E7|nr:hypothetical protein [Kangiella sp. TOML190]